MSEQLWFDFTIEGIFVKGLGPRLTPELRGDLRALGIDLNKLGPAYSVEASRKALEAAWMRVFPTLSKEDAFRELGRLSVSGYLDTMVGKAVLGLVRLMGVKRSLLRLHQSISGGSNYVKATSTLVGPMTIEIVVQDTSEMPTFWEGILLGGTEIAHAKNLRVTRFTQPAPACGYRVEWDES
jgi:uncharacterized protein (TIGR02265 family)